MTNHEITVSVHISHSDGKHVDRLLNISEEFIEVMKDIKRCNCKMVVHGYKDEHDEIYKFRSTIVDMLRGTHFIESSRTKTLEGAVRSVLKRFDRENLIAFRFAERHS